MEFKRSRKQPVLQLHISQALILELEGVSGIPVEEIIVRGIKLLGAYRTARKAGYQHIGYVSNRSRLDVPYLGPTL